MHSMSGLRVLPLVPLALLVLASPVVAQRGGQAEPVMNEINQADNPAFRGLRWRSIGPVGQGGRIDDIAVVETNPSIYYIGFATSGLWKTVNNGTTFEPIFETYGTHSIGDVAIAPSNPDVIYVGTGESNNRQSASFGEGVYRSTDGGKTFTNVGLRETQSIARIVVHPTDPNTAWVAANGHLFGPNPERGVFKTTDGGRTWNKVLYVDENTGATDIVIDLKNPNTLYAATYQRRRTAWSFAAGGGGSGIWKSTDGGRNWTRLSGNGLPAGTMGRIALDIARSNPNVVYAQIEVAPDKEPVQNPPAGRGGRGAGGGGFGGGGRGGQEQPPDPQITGTWRSSNGGQSWQFQSNFNPRPMYFSQIRVDPNHDNVVYSAGLPVAKSTDSGKTFTELDGFGHVDQHAIWIDPNNSDHVMIGNDGAADVSWDGGQSWESLRTMAVGLPYHASVDMRRPYYVCTGLQDNGSWCGPSSVRASSIIKEDWYGVGGGDGFYSAIDPTDWKIVYTESQNGNINRYDLRTGESQSIRPRAPGSGRGGGGGGGGRGGNAPSNIVPAPPEDTQIRTNWNSPYMLSPHNPRVIYVGTNYLFKSMDRGDTYTMGPDLTKAIDRDTLSIMGMKGDLPGCGRAHQGTCILSRGDGTNYWGTITTIDESTMVPGLLWVGTDDGNVQVSRDGGVTWTEVSGNVPGGTKLYYISRVEASHFDPATAWISVDGHRSDDLKPYIFVTHDYGRTWTSIASNLPVWGNVNTIRQDPKNPKLLYAGTEFGFWVSLDEGGTWSRLMTNLPVTRIDDVLVHPRDNDLVLSTHGRSIWILDDVTPLQQMTPEVMTQDAALFEPREAVLWKNDRTLSRAVTGNKNFRGENAPRGTAIAYWLKAVPAGDVRLTITDLASGEVFRTLDATKFQGLNRIQWDLCSDAREVQPGQGGRGFGGFGGGCGGGGRGGGGGGQQGPPRVATLAGPGLYRVTLSVGGKEYSHNVAVLEDIWMNDK
jgi:photosystem II stability/assembly factor-like uncharacterized protein